MNRLTKFIRSLAALLVGAAMFAPLGAWADTWTDESGNVWTYSGSKVTAVSFETTNLTIPDTLGGNPVTAFDAAVFKGKTRAVRVTIPATVTAIPASAFEGCVNLKAVTIQGEGLTSIGYRAFAGCDNLEEFVMPNSVTSLGQGAFSGCSAMESVTLSDSLVELSGVAYRGAGTYVSGNGYGDSADSASLSTTDVTDGLFYNCTSLKTINWGTGIKAIGNVAFLNCSALEKVEIPDTVTEIGYHAFLGCSSLVSVKIGNGVTTVGRMAFRALPNLTKVTFGAKVKEIDVQAFQDCVNLQNFTLPDTIQYLRFRCFAGCNKSLTAVTIPANRDELETELGQGVFSGCSKLETVTFGDTVKTLPGVAYRGAGTYVSGNGYGDSADSASLSTTDVTDGLFYNCTSLKTINWGTGIKAIGNVAFLNCSALEKVEIPDTVTEIGYHAFLGCSSLVSVKIGDGVETIGRMAFRALPNLTKVTFGSKVRVIGQQAFQDCVNLQNFTLPDTIQYIRYRAFAGCSNALTSVLIPTNRDELTTELGQGVFSDCTKLEAVIFGDTVKVLPGVAYRGAGTYVSGNGYGDSADSASLSTTDVTDGLFYNCTSLKTINWGTGIKAIGNVAFLNCSALTDLVLPANITDIGNHSFFGCSSLKTVTMMGNVNSIGRYAFGNCKALHYVDFCGATMTSAPGYMPFAFDRDVVTAYAAAGSKGWNGVADQEGLPESGTWGGARITYAPPPEGAGNPYDFSLATPEVRISRTDYNWPAPVMVTTNRYVHGSTVPQSLAAIREGDPIYLSYAFDEYWRGEAFDVTNRFTLSGAKTGTIDFGETVAAHSTASYWWLTNAVPEQLQNLEPGEYTLTLQLNGDRRLKETDYANNTTSITFTVVGTPRYTVTFDLNGASGTAPAACTVREGDEVGELPEVTAPAGWTFLGWYTAATDGTKATASTKVTADLTLYAQWSKCDIGFYIPSDRNYAQSMFVTSASGGTSNMTSFTQGTRIYLKYAFKNLAGEYDMKGFVNRFSLDAGTTFDDNWSSHTLDGGDYGYDGGNWYPSALQNLVPGTYTLTCTLDADADVLETDESNNTQAITFTVTPGITPQPEYTVTFNANGGSVSSATRIVTSGAAVGTLPTATRSGYTFDGWFASASGGSQVSPSTVVTEDVTYYAHWTPVSDGGTTVQPPTGGRTATGVSAAYTAKKAVVLDGAVYDAAGNVAGVVQLKVAKPNAKKHNAKVSGSITLLDGKKRTLKAAAFAVPEDAPISANVGVKGLGTLSLVIGDDGFEGSVGAYTVAPAKVGGKWTRTDAAVYVAFGGAALPAGTVESLLPDGEPVRAKGGKWAFDKAASIKYKKGALSGDNDPKKPNLSAMKLAYTPKTGLFKGSFKIYALQGGKLKKFTVKVTGVVVDGGGVGVAVLPKSGSFAVTVGALP